MEHAISYPTTTCAALPPRPQRSTPRRRGDVADVRPRWYRSISPDSLCARGTHGGSRPPSIHQPRRSELLRRRRNDRTGSAFGGLGRRRGHAQRDAVSASPASDMARRGQRTSAWGGPGRRVSHTRRSVRNANGSPVLSRRPHVRWRSDRVPGGGTPGVQRMAPRVLTAGAHVCAVLILLLARRLRGVAMGADWTSPLPARGGTRVRDDHCHAQPGHHGCVVLRAACRVSLRSGDSAWSLDRGCNHAGNRCAGLPQTRGGHCVPVLCGPRAGRLPKPGRQRYPHHILDYSASMDRVARSGRDGGRICLCNADPNPRPGSRISVEIRCAHRLRRRRWRPGRGRAGVRRELGWASVLVSDRPPSVRHAPTVVWPRRGIGRRKSGLADRSGYHSRSCGRRQGHDRSTVSVLRTARPAVSVGCPDLRGHQRLARDQALPEPPRSHSMRPGHGAHGGGSRRCVAMGGDPIPVCSVPVPPPGGRRGNVEGR